MGISGNRLAALVVVVAVTVLNAQTKPDFSGTWRLDGSRSESYKYFDQRRQAEPGDVLQILQNATNLKIITMRQGKDQTITYPLAARGESQ
jgi:hypothetical protein